MRGRFAFADRHAAGRALAERLRSLDLIAPVVVGLPRGGVPVAYEVARELGAPLDIGLVRKLGAPGQPELGIGALGEDGTVVVNRHTTAALGIDDEQVAATVAREREELERRRSLYREDAPALDVSGRTVVLVDDGLATGVTALAAAQVLRARGVASVVLAVPVCPAGSEQRLEGHFDRFVCVEAPRRFGGVGSWYADFTQTTDREVVELLRAAREDRAGGEAPG